MNYKQSTRILKEILDAVWSRTDSRSTRTLLQAIEHLNQARTFPRLGPYPRRSPEAILWKLASTSELAPDRRMHALKKLLEMHSGGVRKRKRRLYHTLEI